MRTIDLLLLSQVDSFNSMLVSVGKHDGLERAAGSFGENEVDDTDPDEVQGGK
jgi:hypothetical protein